MQHVFNTLQYVWNISILPFLCILPVLIVLCVLFVLHVLPVLHVLYSCHSCFFWLFSCPSCPGFPAYSACPDRPLCIVCPTRPACATCPIFLSGVPPASSAHSQVLPVMPLCARPASHTSKAGSVQWYVRAEDRECYSSIVK